MPIQTEPSHLSFKYQRGTVLLWGLVGLLVLATLGVAASRISMLDTRIVGNVMFDDFTYQGAESALRRSVNLYNIKQSAEQKVADNTDKAFGPYQDAVSAGEQITSSSSISMGSGIACPPVLSGVAMSTSMTPKSGNIACRLFTVAADSQVAGTSARSEHVAGILKYVPAE